MKVLLVNKFHYVKGGSETYYFGLGELLRQNGVEVVCFSMQDEKNIPCEQEKYFVSHIDFNAEMGLFQKIKAGLNMLYSREAKKKFEQLIKDEKPDIVHLNIFQSHLTGSIVDVAKKYKIPIVYTAHDLKSVCPDYRMLSHGQICEKCLSGDYKNCFRSGCMKDSKLKSLLATLEAYEYKRRKIYQKIDLVITPSAFYKEKIEQSGVMACPIVHIPNFLPVGTEYKASGVKGEYFLYFGRLSREKGVLTLLDAYERANVDLPLYIVGTGPEEEAIQERVEKLNGKEKVRLLGFRQGEELKGLVKNSRCVILPSEWYENGPYSVMEAMAAGKPAIVSNLGGLPELVEDGVTGYVVSAFDAAALGAAMEKVERLSDEALSAMGKAAAEKAREKFDGSKYVEELLQKYEELIER